MMEEFKGFMLKHSHFKDFKLDLFQRSQTLKPKTSSNTPCPS